MKQPLLAALTLGVAAAAAAADFSNPRWIWERPGEEPARDAYSFRELDTDGDGALSPREAARLPLLAANFARADLDGDGRLSPLEFNNFALKKKRRERQGEESGRTPAPGQDGA